MLSELLKYLRNCYSDCLMLAEDPLAFEVIQLLKYFHDFTKFIHQDTKMPAQSCSNTNIELSSKQ